MEGTSKEYAPIEYPAVPDFGFDNSPLFTAKALRMPYPYRGCPLQDTFTDNILGSDAGERYELQNKWEAWKRMGCLASEMESASLFIVGSHLRFTCGLCFPCHGQSGTGEAEWQDPGGSDRWGHCGCGGYQESDSGGQQMTLPEALVWAGFADRPE